MGVVHRQAATPNGTWDYSTVAVKEYNSGNASAGATRRILVGQAEGAEDFIIRYFTLPPGGHSAHEQHAHQHGVVIVHGHGRVLLEDEWVEIGPGDAVFIAPNELHQLQAEQDAPLGFICVIPSWAKSNGATRSPNPASEASIASEIS